jgi:DNA-binding NtrC family response regulator
VISATNLRREQLADESQFRQDLLFRLNTVELLLPPLRERRDDIDDIARHYADFYQRKYQRPARPFSAGALRAMREYAWPGNVRALRHAVERAVILATGDELEAADLQLAAPTATPAATAESGAADGDLNLERMERRLIQAALVRHKYNISHASKELGLTRAALYRRMEKYGI